MSEAAIVGDGSYLEPYRDAVRKSGPRFESLLWRDRRYQGRRFEVFAEMVDLRGRVICDLGCGRADFAAHLSEHGIAWGRYIGVDGVAELVEACRTRAEAAGWAGCVFHERDFAAEAGLFGSLVADAGVEVFAISGALNTFEQPLAERVLQRVWAGLESSGRGTLVFNFLSDRRHGRQAVAPARRFDTYRLLGWALDRTDAVRFRHDYLDGHDATIAMTVREQGGRGDRERMRD